MTIEQEILQLAEKILKVSEESKRNSESALRTANETFAAVTQIEQTVAQLLADDELNDAIALTIPNQQGETNMGQPQTLTVGLGAVQCTAVESKAGVPSVDANGNPIYNGTLAFASDNTAVATIDPVAGLLTPVSAGTANISVLDAIGNLTDSDALTVLAGVTPPTQNDSIALTIPPQTASGRRR
jgi:Bacterial Ig-like domain (group 2)